MSAIIFKYFLHYISIYSFILITQTNGQLLLNETFLEDSPIIETKFGQIEGTVLDAENGRNFYAFLGIPYGKTTTRFQAPQAADVWTGKLDATKDAPICLQFDLNNPNKFKGDEDCLHLNVYTPKLPNDDDFDLMPVMVFINGDEFQIEDASSTTFGPQKFMNKDVVLVVPNYRVGIFGFLSTGDEESTGNEGLLDQVLALKWVKDNIAKFGGDFERVTIFGQDAGATSVTLHLLSPLSRGLFTSAIIQSGSSLCPFAIQPDPLQDSKSIAEALKCPTRNSKDIIECLSLEDPKSIMTAANVTDVLNDYSLLPVIEDSNNGQFLTQQPYDIFSGGKFNKVPVIIGFTEDEAAYLMDDPNIFDLFATATSKDNFQKDIFPALIDRLTELDANDTKVVSAIFDEYFGKANFDNITDLMLTTVQFLSDAVYKSCVDFTARILAKADVPVHAYVFDFATEYSAYSNYTGEIDVIHGSDLNYLFHLDISGRDDNQISDDDKSFSDRLVTLWTNFANTGFPTTASSNFTWELSERDQIKYLKLSKTPMMENDYHADKMNFWSKILKQQFESTT